jgi:hypothetical protein
MALFALTRSVRHSAEEPKNDFSILYFFCPLLGSAAVQWTKNAIPVTKETVRILSNWFAVFRDNLSPDELMRSGAEPVDQPCHRALWIAPIAGHLERGIFEEDWRYHVFSGVCRSLPICFTVWAFSGAFDCCISEHAWQAANVQIDYKAALQTWASGGQAGLIVLSDISEMAALYCWSR